MNIQKIYTLAIMALVVMACGGDDEKDVNLPDGRNNKMNITASVTPYQEYENGRWQNSPVNWTFLNGDVISIWAISRNQQPSGSGTPYSYTDGKFIAINRGIEVDGQKQDFYAVMPIVSVSYGEVQFYINANQSTEDAFWENDLCTAYEESNSSYSVHFDFFHRLCCVCVDFLGDDISGHDVKVQLNGIRQGVACSLKGDDCYAIGSKVNVKTFCVGKEFYAIVPPQSFYGETNLVTIVLDGETYQTYFDDSVILESGTMHYLDITYSANSDSGQSKFVVLSGQINPWEK